jgi:hypothetical protein
LISDSSEVAKKLKENIKELNYWDNSKTHLGDLKNGNKTSIMNTMVDFFIISKSTEIFSTYSGFSMVVSLIFSIKHTHI